MNFSIRQRNAKRRNSSMALHDPDPQLKSKILDAQNLAMELGKTQDEGKIVYTTNRDILEQQIEQIEPREQGIWSILYLASHQALEGEY